MTNNKSFKHKQDPHYIKAKKEGYKARSAFKLLEIQQRYNIFKRVFYILDIGSAPGSWLQVAKEFAEKNLEKYNDRSFTQRRNTRISGQQRQAQAHFWAGSQRREGKGKNGWRIKGGSFGRARSP